MTYACDQSSHQTGKNLIKLVGTFTGMRRSEGISSWPFSNPHHRMGLTVKPNAVSPVKRTYWNVDQRANTHRDIDLLLPSTGLRRQTVLLWSVRGADAVNGQHIGFQVPVVMEVRLLSNQPPPHGQTTRPYCNASYTCDSCRN